ncbi:tetratricopeptide repeat protein [Azospirillum halopraeferens]|uniref:tetratricopeptide repeat protein n=1 Tax=Azospirillum halopraeferens TaxID=34010 RepID=UPI0004276EEE|nr:tetratricopeptide repeat protein [Azospirillum halopraeferens]
MTTVGDALLRAFDLHQSGRLEEADDLYARVLEVAPDLSDALHLRGLLAAQRGRLEEACNLLGRAVAANDSHPDYHANLASVLRALGRPADAAVHLARSLDLHPASPDRRAALADVLESLGRHDGALEQFTAAADLEPAAAAAVLNNYAVRRLRAGDAERAVAALRHAAAVLPTAAQVRLTLAEALAAAGRPGDAAGALRAALCLTPDEAGAALALGRMLYGAGDPAAAGRALAAARRLTPADADGWNLAGCAAKDSGRLDAAEAAFRRALALSPASAEAMNNLGNVLKGTGRFAAAVAVQTRAAVLAPDEAAVLNNLADARLRSGDPDGAVTAAQAALTLAPALADARVTRALALLTAGRLAEGWAAWEARWDADPRMAAARWRFPQPFWSGGPLPEGRRLLVWSEQGVGDEVQFATLLPLLDDRGIRCALECDPRLVPLFARSFPGVTVAARVHPPDPRLLAPDIAAQVPAGSLPRRLLPDSAAFRRLRPALVADPARTATLRARRDPGRLHVGIAWNTTNPKYGRDRNLPLDRLTRALALPGVRLVSLQYGDWSGPIAALAASGIDIVAEPDIDPWSDLDGLAALIASLDLVVSTANITIHLAGALGRPAWALLPHAPDWRWFRDRDDSPWYANTRLFRQPVPGDWDTPLRRVREALEAPGAGPGEDRPA